MDLEDILDIATPMVEGLAEAHSHGILHRDLKPANVMIDERGRVKLLDFGVARLLPGTEFTTEGLTSTGRILGTPYYMSPEQVHGKETDARSDLFSVGVILYEMATGVRPFEARSLAGVLNAVTEKRPTPLLQVNPHVGELFAHVVDRLLEKSPESRFQSAAGVVAELKSLGQPTSITQARKRVGWPGATLARCPRACPLRRLLPAGMVSFRWQGR